MRVTVAAVFVALVAACGGSTTKDEGDAGDGGDASCTGCPAATAYVAIDVGPSTDPAYASACVVGSSTAALVLGVDKGTGIPQTVDDGAGAFTARFARTAAAST